jgi:hypothetical protein
MGYGDDSYDGVPLQNPFDKANGVLRLCARKCTTCIFRPGNQMGLRPGRVTQMTRASLEGQGEIVCHKTLTYSSEGIPEAICHGYWQLPTAPYRAMSMRLTLLFRTPVVYVDPDNGSWHAAPLEGDPIEGIVHMTKEHPVADRIERTATVWTGDVAGHPVHVERSTWRDHDGMSYDVYLRGDICLTVDESYDGMPTGEQVEALVHDYLAATGAGVLG